MRGIGSQLERSALQSLPQVDRAAVPAHVRKEGSSAVKTYQAALGFERVLLGQLTKQVADNATGGDESAQAPAAYRDMLSDSLADSVTKSGGIGLADDIYRALRMGSK